MRTFGRRALELAFSTARSGSCALDLVRIGHRALHFTKWILRDKRKMAEKRKDKRKKKAPRRARIEGRGKGEERRETIEKRTIQKTSHELAKTHQQNHLNLQRRYGCVSICARKSCNLKLR